MAELGCRYGICLGFGLVEVARLARPGDLAGITAVFQVASYTGFAAPYLLSILRPDASAAVLLLFMAVLAALTLMVTVWQASRTAEHPSRRLARRILALAQHLPGLVPPTIRQPPTPATRNSAGPRSANSPTPLPPQQHAATGTSHDQLDKDHRHNADERALRAGVSSGGEEPGDHRGVARVPDGALLDRCAGHERVATMTR